MHAKSEDEVEDEDAEQPDTEVPNVELVTKTLDMLATMAASCDQVVQRLVRGGCVRVVLAVLKVEAADVLAAGEVLSAQESKLALACLRLLAQLSEVRLVQPLLLSYRFTGCTANSFKPLCEKSMSAARRTQEQGDLSLPESPTELGGILWPMMPLVLELSRRVRAGEADPAEHQTLSLLFTIVTRLSLHPCSRNASVLSTLVAPIMSTLAVGGSDLDEEAVDFSSSVSVRVKRTLQLRCLALDALANMFESVDTHRVILGVATSVMGDGGDSVKHIMRHVYLATRFRERWLSSVLSERRKLHMSAGESSSAARSAPTFEPDKPALWQLMILLERHGARAIAHLACSSSRC